MLSAQTKRQLGKLMTSIADSEIQIEVLRQILSEQDCFDPYLTFSMLDRFSKGYLSIADIEKFLEDNEVYLRKSVLFEVYRHFDTNENGKISQIEFSLFNSKQIQVQQADYPKDNEPILTLKIKITLYKADNHFLWQNIKIQWALARVFQQLANNIQLIDQQRSQLFEMPDFNLRVCFELLQEFGQGEINYNTIKTFVLQCCGIDLTFEKLNAFFRVANVLQTGNLTYQEFAQLFFPYGRNIKPILNSPTQYTTSNYKQKRTSSLPRLEPIQMICSPPKRLDQSCYYNNRISKYSDLYEGLNAQRFRNHSSGKKQVQFATDTKSTNYGTPLKQSSIAYQQTLQASLSNQKTSPLKQTEESQLVRILKEQIMLERELEESRKQLIFKNDFNLLDGFRLLDQNGKGFITSNELKMALDRLNVFATDEQIYLLFRRYDKDQDGLLRYSDYCRFCIPLNKQFSKILNDRPPFYSNIEDVFTFCEATLKLFGELFKKGLGTEQAAEGLRKSLNRQHYFHLSDAFAALDKNENGFITLQEFKEIFDDYGVYASREDLISLVKRYDQNLDGKVSYSEFINEMTQKTPTKI